MSAHMQKAPEPEKVPEKPPEAPRRAGLMTYAQLVRWCEENNIREVAKRIAIVKG